MAEGKIAGYPADYVEVDVAGRTTVPWDAARVARIEAGLPVCGHKDCGIPFDTSPVDAGPDSAGPDSAGSVIGRITEEAEVIRRPEDEVFDLLKANWLAVERVVDALCEQDRLTTPELDALITGSNSVGLDSAGLESVGLESVGPSTPELNTSEPSTSEPTLVGGVS